VPNNGKHIKQRGTKTLIITPLYRTYLGAYMGDDYYIK